MANKGHIIVPQGILPVHTFDLWGPVLDAEGLSNVTLDIFREVAQGDLSDKEIERRISEYRELQRGEPHATEAVEKGRRIDQIDGYMTTKGALKPELGDFLQEDGLYVMNELLDAGEGVALLTSKPADHMYQVFPPEIGLRLGTIYGMPKDQVAFLHVDRAERAKSCQFVSHTADELPELEEAVASGLNLALVYVDRNQSNTREKVTGAGIHHFVNDLRDVPYESFVQKE